MTSHQPAPTPSSTDEQPEPKPSTDRPSALQITASALAAMTTTALMSTLGAAGTIIGAALASVITVFANFVYTTSIRRTKEKVTTVVPHRSRLRPDGAAGPVTEVGPTGPSPTPAADDAPAQSGSQPADDAASSRLARLRTAVRTVVDRMGWRRILTVIAGVFVLVIVAVTIIEMAAGKPLTNVVRNEEGAGTSVFGRTTDIPVTPDEVEVPVPEQSPSDVPSPEPTEPTVPEDSPTEVPTSEVPTEQPTEQPTTPTPEPTTPPSPNPPGPGGSLEQPAQPDASAQQAAEPQPAPVG